MRMCMAMEFSFFAADMAFDQTAIEAFYASLPVANHFDADHSVGMCMERSALVTVENYVQVSALIIKGEFSHEELARKIQPAAESIIFHKNALAIYVK